MARSIEELGAFPFLVLLDLAIDMTRMAMMAQMAHTYRIVSQKPVSRSNELAPCRSDRNFLPITLAETPNHQVKRTTNQNQPNKSMYNNEYHKNALKELQEAYHVCTMSAEESGPKRWKLWQKQANLGLLV